MKKYSVKHDPSELTKALLSVMVKNIRAVRKESKVNEKLKLL